MNWGNFFPSNRLWKSLRPKNLNERTFKKKLASLIGKIALTHLREKKGASFSACVWASIIATDNKIDEFAWIIVASVNNPNPDLCTILSCEEKKADQPDVNTPLLLCG